MTKSRRTTRQSFELGATVKVGFVANLQVVYGPMHGAFVLRHATTGRAYTYRAHHGLERCEERDAQVTRLAQLRGLIAA